jgi:hypothetical protein
MPTPDLKETLTALVAATLDLIKQGRNDGTFVQTEEAHFRWRLQGELTYNERGVNLPPAQGERYTRPSWGVAVAKLIQGGVLQTKEYQAAVAALQRIPRAAQERRPIPTAVHFGDSAEGFCI